MRNFLLGCFVASAFWLAYHSAAQDYIIGSGIALHLDRAHHCNSITSGLGYEHSQSENWRYQVGFYRNSQCRWSTYIAEAWLPIKLAALKLGLIGGAVTGYSAPILPAGGLVASYEPKNSPGFNLIFIPPAGESGKGVLWGQIKWEW